mmetsp:Transcript_12838/g.16471  ORF Transcript_12838/g.16471 Transcript_12838/m.16471 type:complete len:91 (+) Transcript_12838:117-389(+)
MPTGCSQTWRHFKALNRKNAIVWKRSPLCTIFQILFPVALMAFMCWARSEVRIKHTDLVSLGKYKHPVFPALRFNKLSKWVADSDYVTDV